MANTQNKLQNSHRKTWLLPPESGPQSQGLKYNYNTVKTVKQSGEKINGRHRQSASKRTAKRI